VNTPANDRSRSIILLTAREVADLLGVHVRSVWRMAQAGDIPAPIRLSERVVRWRMADLEVHFDLLAGRRRRVGKGAPHA
jgi:excisionase family DNA binding protein